MTRSATDLELLEESKKEEKGEKKMKSTMKKVMATVLICAMALPLVACGSKVKKITAKEFKKTMKAEDYRCVEGSGKKYKDMVTATSEDGDIQVIYYLFKDADKAKDDFEEIYDTMKETKEEEDLDGSVKKSGNKITVNIYDDDDHAMYVVSVRNAEMVITAMARDNDKSTIKEVDDIIKKLVG